MAANNYKIGDRIIVVSKWTRRTLSDRFNWHLGQIRTIASICERILDHFQREKFYMFAESQDEGHFWDDQDIVGLAPMIPKQKFSIHVEQNVILFPHDGAYYRDFLSKAVPGKIVLINPEHFFVQQENNKQIIRFRLDDFVCDDPEQCSRMLVYESVEAMERDQKLFHMQKDMQTVYRQYTGNIPTVDDLICFARQMGLYEDKVTADANVHILPAAETAPVVHGRWEWFEEWDPSTPDHPRECEDCGWRCGKCKRTLEDMVGGYWDNPDEKPKLNHCPNCGAEMDLEECTNSCENCAKRKEVKNECPWDGTYRHKDEHGNEIGICNAYEKEINSCPSCNALTDEPATIDCNNNAGQNSTMLIKYHHRTIYFDNNCRAMVSSEGNPCETGRAVILREVTNSGKWGWGTVDINLICVFNNDYAAQDLAAALNAAKKEGVEVFDVDAWIADKIASDAKPESLIRASADYPRVTPDLSSYKRED